MENRNNGPKPLFGSMPPIASPSETKRTNATGPKELFKDLAISENIVDPELVKDPLCFGISNKDIGRIKRIINDVKLTDVKYTIGYADGISEVFVKLVNDMVEQITSGKLGQINTNVSNMIDTMGKINESLDQFNHAQDLAKSWISRTFSEVPSVPKVISDLKFNITKVDLTIKEMVADVDLLLNYVDSLDSMFVSNKESFNLLHLHVIAGKIVVNNYTTKTIPYQTAHIKANDPFALQDLGFLKASVDRFDRKVLELEKLEHSVLLNASRIRNMQTNNILLAERIKYAAQYLVPAWKAHCADIISFIEGLGIQDMCKLVSHPKFVSKQQAITQLIDEQTKLAKSFS